MKKVCYYAYICPLLFTLTVFIACAGQENPREKIQFGEEPPSLPSSPPDAQIAEYIRHIFQDKNGNLWFGTNGYGIAHYDGDSLYYFSNAQGFGGQQITGITEDPEKNIWFATDQGVVKYDWTRTDDEGKRFTNYTDNRYFGGQRFWSIFADSKSNIWAGSVAGIFRFDGVDWTPFKLPYPEEITGEFITESTTWSISQDRAGNIWFSTNGFGAFKYDPMATDDPPVGGFSARGTDDPSASGSSAPGSLRSGGKSFTQYSKKDGLTDNSVDQILEDSKGNIWFGTRHGGLSCFNGESFVNYTQSNGSIGNDEVCVIYEDKAGNIWFSSEGFGVYRFNASLADVQGESFTNFSEDQGLGVRAVQTIFEDREGRVWVGGGGGLYRYDRSGRQASFINVTKNGPWK